MKKLLKVILIIFLVFAAVGIGGVFFLSRGLNQGSKLVINDVKPASLNDGAYTGKYDSGRWTNELKVTVKDGKIANIEVVKDVMVPKPEWTQELFKRVIEKQSTQVDVVSGATVTSKAYLKAIENAIKK